VLDVVAHGLGRHDKLGGNRLVREAAGEQHEDLDLALRQTGRALPPPRDAVTRRAEHRVDRVAVEPAPAYLLAQLSRGVLG
jgi:hypothetical protein